VEFKYKLEMLPWLMGMLVITSCVHEAGHAWAAWRCGDQNDYIDRRRNPLSPSHISLIFTLLLPAIMILALGFMVGGAKPVQVRMSVGPGRMALVALSGPAGNLLVALVALLGLAAAVHLEWLEPYLSVYAAPTPYFFALFAVAFSVFLGVLNLIPIPPLDGSRVVAAALPERARDFYYRRLTIPGILVLLVGFICLVVFYPEEMSRGTMWVIGKLDTACKAILEWIES
jgi:Zn-dependent protease